MDELEISGKRYISSRRAAKQHGYHSDYIGQLVRAGKVDGQKVGRAWYVDEESLKAYFSKEPMRVERSVETVVPSNVQKNIQVAEPVEKIVVTATPVFVNREPSPVEKSETFVYERDTETVFPTVAPRERFFEEKNARPVRILHTDVRVPEQDMGYVEEGVYQASVDDEDEEIVPKSRKQKFTLKKIVTLSIISFITFTIVLSLSLFLNSILRVTEQVSGL